MQKPVLTINVHMNLLFPHLTKSSKIKGIVTLKKKKNKKPIQKLDLDQTELSNIIVSQNPEKD